MFRFFYRYTQHNLHTFEKNKSAQRDIIKNATKWWFDTARNLFHSTTSRGNVNGTDRSVPERHADESRRRRWTLKKWSGVARRVVRRCGLIQSIGRNAPTTHGVAQWYE
jgi:hypothetical protein